MSADISLEAAIGVKGAAEADAAFENFSNTARKTAEATRDTGRAAHEAGAEWVKFRSPIAEAAFAIFSMNAAMRETLEILGEISGAEIANKYNVIAFGLQNVAGSARTAAEWLEKVQSFALSKSIYNPADLASAIPAIVASGGSESDIRPLTNLAAEGNVQRDQMTEFLDLMTRMRNMDHIGQRFFTNPLLASLPLASLANAGGGQHFTSRLDAQRYLEGLRGDQAYNVLTKGIQQVDPNASQRQLASNPFAQFTQALTQLEESMIPTGNLILKVITPAIFLISQLVGWFDRLNKNGIAGLLIMIALLVKGWRLVTDTIKGAWRWTNDLAAALERYGEAAQTASTRTATNTAATEMNTGARVAEGATLLKGGKAAEGAAKEGEAAKASPLLIRLFAWIKNLPELIKGLPALLKAAPAMKGAELFGGLLKLGKGAAGPLGWAALGLGILGDNMHSRAGAALSEGSNGAFIGGILGELLLGPWGAAAGGLIGGGVGGYMGYKNYKPDPDDAAQQNTDALKKNTQALMDIHARALGNGGSRTNRVMGDLEAQYAVMHALVGVG